MSITYTLKITELEVIPTVGTYTNVVSRMYGRYEAVNENGVRAFKYYSQPFPLPGDSFIEFNDLTKEILDQWLERFYNSVLKVNWEQQLSQEINNKTVATSLKLPPWE